MNVSRANHDVVFFICFHIRESKTLFKELINFIHSLAQITVIRKILMYTVQTHNNSNKKHKYSNVLITIMPFTWKDEVA